MRPDIPDPQTGLQDLAAELVAAEAVVAWLRISGTLLADLLALAAATQERRSAARATVHEVLDPVPFAGVR